MTPEHFKKIVAVLLPEMGDVNARRSIIESALYSTAVLPKIQWDGAAQTFTVRLVRQLNDYGNLSPGRPAVVALLEEIKGQVGADRQAEIDRLLAQFDSPAPTMPQAPLPATVNAPVIPPKAEHPIAAPRPAPSIPVTPVEGPTIRPPAVPQGNPQTEASLTLNQTISTPRWPRMKPFRPNILVMKGGGVKGIAYVGALEVLEQYGYHFDHFVGTSAGAITAALLAVGYTSQELKKVLAETDFRQFKDGWLPLSILSLYFTKGLYEGEKFRIWLENKLRDKFKKYPGVSICFQHLKQPDGQSSRLTIFASREGQTAYSFDSEKSSDEEISFACRCSMAIPYFFKPEKIGGKWVVDGGMQNNYPIDALLKYFNSLSTTKNFIGMYLGPKQAQVKGKWMLLNLLSIWGESGDEESKKEFIDRTIVIDPRPVRTTDFSLSPNDVAFLVGEGRASALRWVYEWSDGKRPSAQEVENAEQEAERLRTVAIEERWRKFWWKTIGRILILGMLVVGGFLIWRI